MTDTVNLGLPCIEGSQAQKHVTHNDALRILDTLVQLAVLDRDLTTPPGSPTEGQRWIVKTGATGAWVGHVNAIAAWQDGAWQFSAPKTGWVAFVADEATLLVWNGTAWGDFFSTVTSIQNLAMLGVGTAADATNPLSAKLNNALFAAKTVAEGGDGNLRYKLSKESAAKTLSFLFQDNFSGRAEIGLTGDDDFHFKVSADGTTWFEGIKIAKSTGAVTFPNTTISGGREILTANRIYYVRTDGSNSNNGLANTSGGAFLTLQKAMDVIAATLDVAGFDVTVQVGAGTYTAGVNIKPWLGAGTVTFVGDQTTPSNVFVNPTAADGFDASFGPLPGKLYIKGFKITCATSGFPIVARSLGRLIYTNIEFGAAAFAHVIAGFHGSIEFYGNMKISGGAAYHFYADGDGTINCDANDNPAPGTFTLTGTPAFSGAFAHCSHGYMGVSGITFSGSATGPRYEVTLNGVIFTGGGGSYFPGNSAGSVATGGLYA